MVLKHTTKKHTMKNIALRFEVSLRTAVSLFDFTREHDGELVASNVVQFRSEGDRDEVPYLVSEYRTLLDSFDFEVIGCQVILLA
jgi:hypothetical protein